MEPLAIRSGQGDYGVDFLATVDEAAARVMEIPGAVVAVDRNVANLHAGPLGRVLDSRPTLLLDATEEEKTPEGVTRFCTWLQQQNCTKQSILVAIGGGIVQDIVAFSSHVYYRGIRWAFVPTTLLAMSDSCIGAKCCLNLNAYKNQLGAFHSPCEVLLSTGFVDTLDDRDVASGYGEILKLLLTGGESRLATLESVVEQGGLRNGHLDQLVRESLEVKKSIIETDEYERDLRRVLNFGHTFGHSLETSTNYEVPHGLAVAWGIDLVNFIALRRGMLEDSHFQRVHRFIIEVYRQAHLPVRSTRTVAPEELIRGARRDKKVVGDQVNLILAQGPGRLEIVKVPFDSALESQVSEYVERYNVLGCNGIRRDVHLREGAG